MNDEQEQEQGLVIDGAAAVDDEAELERVLEHVRLEREFDFSGYKRDSLGRRIRRRMQTVGCTRYGEYLDYLEVHPDEFQQLFNTILINVTSFFRDAGSWEALQEHLGRLVASRSDDEPIRLWSAGCASGEEAYSLAMVMFELLGREAFVRRVKIYATDVDEDALAQARAATYSAKAVEGVPPDLLERHFTRCGDGFMVHKELRRQVIFGRHDLVQDAPISRVDLLACRNTLMYFNAETQTKILGRLHFALVPDGILFLGKAEMLLTHSTLFTPVDLKLRLFARTSRPGARERPPHPTPGTTEGPGAGARLADRLPSASFDALPLAAIVVDTTGRVALVNQRAAAMFGLGQAVIGRFFHDLEISYRPAELRSLLDTVRDEKRPVRLDGVERALASGEKAFLDIEVGPLLDQGAVLGTAITFIDSTRTHRLQGELRNTSVELETSHAELQSTSEELETTNEELQSTIEELETTNEELQSTNEELETMNEELQATNEELHGVNEAMRQRTDALNDVNAYLESILAHLRCGVAVVDRDLVVKAWNERMVDLWGLRSDEVVGQQFLSLDIGLPLDRLSGPLVQCLQGEGKEEQVLIECTNRRGRSARLRITVRPLEGEGSRGLIVLVEEE